TDVNGRALAYAVYNWLVPALAELQYFFSASPEEVASLAGYYLPGDEENEDDEESPLTLAPPDFRPPPEVWFLPEVGLSALREALLVLQASSSEAYVGTDKQENWLELTIQDLEAVEKALLLAKDQG